MDPSYEEQYSSETTSQANGVSDQTLVKTEDPPATSAASQQSEWERYWEIVKTNPDDFASWEYLIRLAETAEGGLTPQSPPENISNMRTVYDQFLAKFPLCFGYWKKYADLEFALEGAAAAEKIYERGVAAIANSVDLWTQYCAFKIEHTNDEEAIRGLFERGAAYVGLDFLAHIFWDKYLEYEESKEAYDRVLKILERIIRIPMHQYAKFFDKYTQLCPTRPVTELVTMEQYQQLEAEARTAPPPPPPENSEEDAKPAVPAEKTEEQIQADIRMRIYNMNVEIYMKTQAETNKRWPFESEIKRPYFHVKPMDDVQLINWRRYLDFEETEGDETRIQVLFERCLVACALYDEFWQRYARWMLSKNRIDDVRNIYQRATAVFIPISRPGIHLAFACFEEEQGRVTESRTIYKQIMEHLPGHVETISKYAHFERRQTKDVDTAFGIIQDAIQSETLVSDSKAKAFLAVQKAKLLWHNKNLVADARKIYQEGSQEYSDSKYFWLNYIIFELSQKDENEETEKRIGALFDQIRNSTALLPETIREFLQHYLDFLMERGSSIALYNKIDVEVNGPITARPISDSKKRSAEDEDLERAAKLMRVDTVESPLDGSPSAAGTYAAASGANASSSAAQAAYYAQPQWAAYTAAGATAQVFSEQAAYDWTAAATPATTQTPAAGWDYTAQSATGY